MFQAVDEPSFSVAYAQMCKVLGTMQVPADRKNKDEQPEYVNFRKLLVNRCQSEFEKSTEVPFNREARLKEIEETTDPVSYVFCHMFVIVISCTISGGPKAWCNTE